MPYKPTGKPRGRPRKVFNDPAVPTEATPLAASIKGKKPRYERARRAYREAAELASPANFIQMFDSRGRPRRAPSSQRRIG